MTSYTETWPPSGLVRHFELCLLGCLVPCSFRVVIWKRGVASLPPPPPPPPLLAPTPGWPPRDGLVSPPQLPTPGWPLRERRETPPRQCVFFCLFCFLFFVVVVFCRFFFLFFFFFFFFGGEGRERGGVLGLGVGGFSGGGGVPILTSTSDYIETTD